VTVGITLGSYELHREIGRGGMGAVYVGRHQLLGRSAAIKILLPQYSRDQELVQRFFNEARAATAVRHPGIVEIFDFGYAADGSAYIVMELCEGESLATRLHRTSALPVANALAIARQIAGALSAAHRAGIVHRDLKPDNIFIVPDPDVAGGERIKLLDFGIAKLTNDSLGAAATQTGAIMGTPYYMSPEQCRGAGKVDHRADLYSLGCILFEMLCGRVPFVGNGPGDIISAHLLIPPPQPSALAAWVPGDVEALVLALLAKTPDARPNSADEVVVAIHRLLGSAPSQPAIDVAALGAAARSTSGVQATVPPQLAYGTAPTYGTAPPPVAPAPKARGRKALVAVIIACPLVAIAVIAIYLASAKHDGEPRKPDKPDNPGSGAEGVNLGSALDKVVSHRACTIAKLDGCTEACDAGDFAACTRLGLAHEWGASREYSLGHAVAMYMKACDGGFADGCARLGALYDYGRGVKYDAARAVQLYQRACDAKSALGCNMVADRLAAGREIEMNPQRELELRTRACDLGLTAACADAASNLEFGERVPADPARAKTLFERAFAIGKKACDDGDAESCDKVGQMYFWGLHLPRDHARALVMFQRACDLGYPATCTELGFIYKSGRGVHRDEQRAKSLIDKACQLGTLDACVAFGEYFEFGLAGVAVDYAKARALYQAACDVDHASGCRSLGFVYANGHGVPKDPARASTLYRKACDLGEPFGCIELANALKKQDPKIVELNAKACTLDSKTCHFLGGSRMDSDPKTALALFERACAASGGETGCNWVGYMYLTGKGVAKDVARGVKYYEDACESEDSGSCVGLGDMYLNGSNGLTKDPARALALYERACTFNYGLACHRASDLHASGKAGAPNPQRAAELRKLACTLNDPTACKEAPRAVRPQNREPSGRRTRIRPPIEVDDD
jgi:TPR repeat protein/tRNA A-37 threonylcarbamoyl transferase component Bud32